MLLGLGNDDGRGGRRGGVEGNQGHHGIGDGLLFCVDHLKRGAFGQKGTEGEQAGQQGESEHGILL